MKWITPIILLVLISATSLALGFGIINNQDYGDVKRRCQYNKTLKVFPKDSDYAPYTDIPVPDDYYATVKITKEEAGKYIESPEYVKAKFNEYTNIPVTLKVPRRIKRGIHAGKICGIGQYASGSGGTIGINIGACADVSFNVVRGRCNNGFKLRRIKFKK